MSASRELVMPKLGLTMTEGTLAQWHVAKGEKFSRGTILATIETDKIASDIEAVADGVMGSLLVNVGEVVKVGSPIGRWAPDSPDQEQPIAAPNPAHSHPGKLPPEVQSALMPEPEKVLRSGSRIIATPFARKLAREQAVDLGRISGSGPAGRIKASDVISASTQQLVVAQVPTAHVSAVRESLGRSIASIDVRADGLAGIGKRIGRSDIEHVDWIILALGRCGIHRLGIVDLASDTKVGVIELPERLSIGTVGALRRAPSFEALPSEEFAIALLVAGNGIRSFVPAPPDGWRYALGICAGRSDGRGAELLNLGFSYEGSFLDHATAHKLLADMRDLLEEPLSLMAG